MECEKCEYLEKFENGERACNQDIGNITDPICLMRCICILLAELVNKTPDPDEGEDWKNNP